MKVLDLFSGIGGFSLGLERAGMETVAFCEINKFCQKVLRKHWPRLPIYSNIKELDGTLFRGSIDVVCGGFPCQPFSAAGKRKGKDDDRDLWPEMLRIIREARPRWVIGENVAGFINMEFERTAADLEAEGYEVQAFVIPACGVGAPHRRDRIWIIAHAEHYGSSTLPQQGSDGKDVFRSEGAERAVSTEQSEGVHQPRYVANSDGERQPQPEGLEREVGRRIGDGSEIISDSDSQLRRLQQERSRECEAAPRVGNDGEAQLMADADSKRGCSGNGKRKDAEDARQSSRCEKFGNWNSEPDVGRVANGVPARVDRLKGLGNAVVPQIPEAIGRLIMEIENAEIRQGTS